MERDSKEALSKATIWLHWIVGVAVIGMLTVGVYMDATLRRVLGKTLDG